ncbi:PREDICTED: uncharacterized protein KIAA1586-like [Priapulus caudatus]|uniref:Uncharacterized protein KIAA1586-like n=1 Tax=Priapulus caudatus TaxID=37621 RepID=A0ABM1F9H9_PRICU|nr:PREDICTED: uncharacterized protein KIAA1586-like [Priapulus caudatus]
MAKAKVEKLNKHCLFMGCKSLEPMTVDDRVKYSSYDSVNDMLDVMASGIKTEILCDVTGAKFYALLFDESTDVSVTQTLMIYIRYVSKGRLMSRFLSVSALHGCTAEDIHKAVKETLSNAGLPPSSMIAVGTDGASTMTGSKSGVTTRMKDENPFLMSDHCGAHRLALAAGQAAKVVPYLVSYQETVNALCKLFKYSPKQKSALKEIQGLVNDDQLTYHEVFETRWLSFNNCVQAVRRTLDSLLTYLSSCDKNNAKAKGILKKVSKFKFIATTHLLADSLVILSQLCLVLQKSKLLYSDMVMHAKATISALTNLKDHLENGAHYKEFKSTLPEIQNLQCQTSFDLHGHAISYSTKQAEEAESCAKQFLNNAIQNLQSRFLSEQSNSKLFAMFEVLVPGKMPPSEADLGLYGQTEIAYLAKIFGADKTNKQGDLCHALVDATAMVSEWQLFKYFMFSHTGQSFADFWCMVLMQHQSSYPNISLMGQLFVTLPSTTVDVERGFSRHNLVKTALRNNLKTESVCDILTIKIEGPEEEMFDFEKCYVKWCAKKDRRIFLPAVKEKIQTI